MRYFFQAEAVVITMEKAITSGMTAISQAKIAQNAYELLEEAEKCFGVFKNGFGIKDEDIQIPIAEFMSCIKLLMHTIKWIKYGRHWFDEGDMKKGLACIHEGIQFKPKIEQIIAGRKLAMIDEYLKHKLKEI